MEIVTATENTCSVENGECLTPEASTLYNKGNSQLLYII